MRSWYFTALKLRQFGYTIGAHIPDHAVISSLDVGYEQISRPSYTSRFVTSVLNVPRFDDSKFVWYRKPPSIRLLVSRNKREGHYLGWGKMGHRRMGGKKAETLPAVKAEQPWWERAS